MRIHGTGRLAAAAAVAAAALALAAFAGAAAADTPVNATTPCVGLTAAPLPITHVIVLFMENQPYRDIVGSPNAPYFNALAQRCGQATNYHNITHPSAPEYIAATSGIEGGAGDCPPIALSGWPAPCPVASDNIFNQLLTAGKTWKVYEEDMKQNCFEGNNGNYDINHNPAAYYTDLGGPSGTPNSPCAQFDVPMGSPQAGAFETDLANGTLPSYSFIAPDLIDDTHNGTIAQGDQYLSQLIPTILNSPQYENGSTVLFLTWDEGEDGNTNDCAYNTTDIGCHVAMAVVSPYTRPGTVSGALYNHYSLLKTSEALLGLPSINHANDAAVQSMAPDFGLLSQTTAQSDLGGTVAGTLSLTLGAPVSFGAFTPGVAADYTVSTTADVISTAAAATLSVTDPSATQPGYLLNGTYVLAQPLQARATDSAQPSSAFAALGAGPLALLGYTAPISNDAVTVQFKQSIGAGDPLRTGVYAKTLTFTLSTTTL